MSCLDNIVTLGLCPDDGVPSSGLKLIDAGGITLKNLAKAATETYTSGVNMAMAKKSLAIKLLSNDFIGALQSNGVMPNISNPVYNTSIFNTQATNGYYNGERGVTVYRVDDRGSRLRSLTLEAIELYPLQSGDSYINITDGYSQYSYPVTLLSNQVNTFDASNLDGFPFVVQSGYAKVTISNENISFAKSPVICHTGCSGLDNSCGWADGWNGTGKVPKEGYGVNVKFKCECNYEQILCDLYKGFTGELLWLKWQILIFDEQLKSNRFNEWIIYNRDELKDYIIPQLKSEYNAKWGDLMGAMPGILNTYKDSCIVCKSIRWVSSI